LFLRFDHIKPNVLQLKELDLSFNNSFQEQKYKAGTFKPIKIIILWPPRENKCRKTLKSTSNL
jgi:hypothetical protein